MPNTDYLKIEDARLIFKNFSGRETKYNRPGDRNFCVVVDDETAKKLIDDGWNVRVLSPRDENEEVTHYIRVAVNFAPTPPNVPPNILMISNGVKTEIGEEDIDKLDFADIRTVDVLIRPRFWESVGKSGIKAYLKTLVVILCEDDLMRKYAKEEPVSEEVNG